MLRYAADAIVVVHFLIAGFIVGGLPLIWVGRSRSWRWIHGRLFRALHLGAITFVALETLADYVCPLTVWEATLRGRRPPASFVGYWLDRILFYSLAHWVFALAYGLWALATLLTWWLVPPSPRRSSHANSSPKTCSRTS